MLNRSIYWECGHPWDSWAVEEPDDDNDWVTRTPAVRHLSLLESGALNWNGTEIVDGERAMVITGKPIADAINNYHDNRSRPMFGGPSIGDAVLRAWLYVETGRFLRTELCFTVSEGDIRRRRR